MAAASLSLIALITLLSEARPQRLDCWSLHAARSARIAIPLYHYWLIQPNIHWDNIYNHPVEKASQIDSRNKNIFTISSITVFITVVKYVVGVRKGKVTLLSNLVICKHDHYRENRLHNLNLLIICSWIITCTYLYIDWKRITCIVNLMTLRSAVCQRTG